MQPIPSRMDDGVGDVAVLHVIAGCDQDRDEKSGYAD